MEFINIPFKYDVIDKILHVSDIHIRNYQRHKEYISVFKQLYKEVDKLPKNSIVYVGGDIVHSKTDISPELIKVTSDFLNNLANRRTTIVITGNHDTNLNNTSRLDTLTPIIDAIGNPNLHYLKDSGVYEIGNVHFTVFSIFDDPKTYIKADTFEAETKVALFHGALDRSVTDVGYRVKNGDLPIDMFDGYDMSMLGDIHKRQFYDSAKTILQVGSLVQQNFGESYDNHGCAIWDVATREASFVNFRNERGFYTIDIEDGKLPDLDGLPKYPRLRLRTVNTTRAEVKTLVKEIRQRCKPTDIVTIRNDKINSQSNQKTSQAVVRNIRDINYQNELLEKYITEHHLVDDSMLSTIYGINKSLNQNLSGVEITRHINWKPKVFEFSNMFSYGRGNVIDFEKTNGIVGLFAPNHSGKSALLDAVSFCLFDKCSRGRTAGDIMNNKCASFQCKLNFEIEGQDYFIERLAKRQKNGSVKVNVNFWTIENDNVVSLNGEQRRDTNRNIKGLLGTYDDFVLTALSVQNNNTGFIDKSQTEKKDLLAQFLDISVFEELYQKAQEETRDVTVLLRNFKNIDYDYQLIEQEENLEKLNELESEVKSKLNSTKEAVDTLNSEILELNKKLIQVESTRDEDKLNDEKQSILSDIDVAKSKLKKYEGYSVTNEEKTVELLDTISKIDVDELKRIRDIWQKAVEKQRELTQQIELMKVSVKSKLDKLNAIGQFDPNCDFCKNTPFVQSAFKIQEELDVDKVTVSELLSKKEKADEFVSRYGDVQDQFAEYESLQKELEKYKRFKSEIEIKSVKRQSEISDLTNKLENVERELVTCKKNKSSVEHNERITEEIDNKISDRELVEIKYNKINNELQDIVSDKKVAKSQIGSINDSIRQAHDLEVKLKAYEYYLDAVKRNGIPYAIISDILPYIESEVNQTLSQVVDFTIEFNVDGKNILTNIVYDDDNKWALELTSGMEKFIASIAIRVALINISNLPRPNFLCIDEGLGNLDASNLSNLPMLLDYLKSEFDFIMMISHIDVIRDFVDQIMTIDRSSDFSKVVYT